MTYRFRGYLPHFEVPESTYFVTFRLAGTLPKKILDDFRMERESLLKIIKTQNRKLISQQEMRLKYLESSKIQQYLDKGKGDCWLGLPDIAELVKNALLFFEGTRYCSYAFCLMPNHVHWLLTPNTTEGDKPQARLMSIMHSIKSFTANEANKKLNRKGHFWVKEYYDHLVRSSEQFGRLLLYTLENPVKAGLCKAWQEWPWTWCSPAIRSLLVGE
jgi:REP element-mobilizing transposase RayT